MLLNNGDHTRLNPANGLFSIKQNSFRKYRSTYNSLQDIQDNTKKTFNNNQVLGLVSLDIAKAYDTIWRPGTGNTTKHPMQWQHVQLYKGFLIG